MLKELTQEYIFAFNSKDSEKLSNLFIDDFALEDPVVKRIEGKENVLKAIQNIFDSSNQLSFKAENIFVDGNISIIEFILTLDDTVLTGVDIIEWDGNKMTELRAYLDIPKG